MARSKERLIEHINDALRDIRDMEECKISGAVPFEFVALQDFQPRVWASIYGAKQLLFDALMALESMDKEEIIAGPER